MEITPPVRRKRKISWQVLLGIFLVALSAAAYAVQILIFQRAHETFFLMLQDFAFVPISVLLVTLILEGVLSSREKKSLQTKLYMVIGTFFTEMGMELLRILSAYDRNLPAFREAFIKHLDFSAGDLKELTGYLKGHEYRMQSDGRDIGAVREFLAGKRDAVLRLLENPNLLEHETFTDLLWAVSHLTEELAYRRDLNRLTAPDRSHLEIDMARAYALLTSEWLAYVRHLRVNYPYIFSLVTRINPFNPAADAEVREVPSSEFQVPS